jgi:hypothetical protein
VVSLVILFLWSFAGFNISNIVASTGHTNTTLGNSGCLQAQTQKFAEINSSKKTKYKYKINAIAHAKNPCRRVEKVEGHLQCLSMTREQKAIQVLVNHQHSNSGTTPSHTMLISLVDRQKDNVFQINMQHDPPSRFTLPDKNLRNAQHIKLPQKKTNSIVKEHAKY